MARKRWGKKLVASSRVRKPAKRTRRIVIGGGKRRSDLVSYTPRRHVRGISQYRKREGYKNTWSWVWPWDRFKLW